MRPIEEMYCLDTVNSIKRENNIHETKNNNLVGMIEEGLVEVTGRDPEGHNLYSPTEETKSKSGKRKWC